MTTSYRETDGTVEVDRRTGKSRREPESDRRRENRPVAEDRRQGERRKSQRRRQIDPTTCERDYTGDEIEFMQALDAYKRRNGRMFPTCSEILEVIRSLGYVKISCDGTAAPADLSASPAEDTSAELLSM